MKITYLGHSCFLIESNGVNIIIDPFYDEAKFGPKPDFVIATHGHFDHLGHAEKLCKNGAKFIGTGELGNYLKSLGVAEAHSMNIGGFFDFGAFRLKLTDATHGSSVDMIHDIGRAVGVIIEIDNKTIYHAGDTGLFGDMELLGRRHNIDIAMLPIGGNFTMDIEDAIYAVGLLKPKIAIPMHYNTFPVISANPQEFVDKVSGGLVLDIGESKEF
ncbi:MAG: metal-dependent hydrolase [Alphaproteobacteria bacterium]|nr:metal-dependent hydrolase [Alphaproteobacteria bacterium]